MSLGAMLAVKHLRGVSPAERVLLYAMADYADRDGGSVWPSVQTLADECEVTTRTVQRAIETLRVRGLIEPTGLTGPPGRQTVRYRLLFVEGCQFVTGDVGVTQASPDPEIRSIEIDPLIRIRRSGSIGSGVRMSPLRHPSEDWSPFDRRIVR